VTLFVHASRSLTILGSPEPSFSIIIDGENFCYNANEKLDFDAK
jgi:hypothetical protein